MKAALCLSGQSRTFKKCFKSQYNHIIKPLNADVFIHTWAYAGNSQIHATHNQSYDINKYVKFVDSYKYSTPLTAINQLYKPKTMVVEYPDYNFFIDKMKQSKNLPDQDKNSDKWYTLFKNNNRYKWFNLLMMHYGIYKSNSLKKKFEDIKGFKYDLVIRCRFDLLFKKAIIDEVEKNVIYLPPNEDIDIVFNEGMKKQLQEKGPAFMPNDKFAYGNSGAMDYYSSIYEFYNRDVDYYLHHGEASVSQHLWDKNNSEYKNIKINDKIKMKIQR